METEQHHRAPDLAAAVRTVQELASGVRDDVDECLSVVLRGLRHRLGFDVAFVGHLVDGTRVFRAAEGGSPGGVEAGRAEPAEDTFCARVVDGRLPEFVPDATAHPAVRALEVTRALPVGTHLSVPIRFSDGSVYGTLCGFSHRVDPRVREDGLGVMRLVARLLARHLERDGHDDDRRDDDRRAVLGVLAAGGPTVVLQPVRDLVSLQVVGYEALSRFVGDELPDAWFARAALAGLGTELELAAVEAALGHRDRVPAGRYLAVNVSAQTLCSPALLAALSGRAGLAGGAGSGGDGLAGLVLELTEQTGVPDYDLLRCRTAALRERGARVAVDDAGAGHAGLQRIVEIAPDIIKIDRGLVRDVTVDPARQAMVQALVWFARRTGATVVAEGVETQAELVSLRGLDVPAGQGWLLGRPSATEL